MSATSKISKRPKFPAIPEGIAAAKPATAAEVERILRADGFKPTDAAAKRRLKAAGNLGMPKE